MTSKDINNKLNSFLQNRFTLDELNKRLSYLFGCEVDVRKDRRETYIEGEPYNTDDNFIFEVNNKDINLRLNVELYFILDNQNRYYITEKLFKYYE